MKKTSARNAFTGTINRIKRGDLLVEVEILTSTGLQVVSIITAESADNLELREGINTTATIKAPWVIISTGRRAHQRTQPLLRQGAERPARRNRSRSPRHPRRRHHRLRRHHLPERPCAQA